MTKKVAIIYSEGLIGQCIRSRVIPMILSLGLEPILLNAGKPPTPNYVGKRLNLFDFYEIDLMKNFIGPYLEANTPLVYKKKPIRNLSYSCKQLQNLYNINLFKHFNINSIDQVSDLIEKHNIIGFISIRNYNVIKANIIETIKQNDCFLWNIHGGLLPKYKGIYIPYYCIENNEPFYGWTLHEISAKVDCGNIIATAKKKLNKHQDILQTYMDIIPASCQMLKKALQLYLQDGKILSTPQKKPTPNEYYKFPTDSDFNRWDSLGIKYASEDSIIDIYTKYFSLKHTQHAHNMALGIKKRLEEYNKDYIVKAA